MSALDIWKGDRPSSLLNMWEPFSQDFDRMFRDMERFMSSPLRRLAGGNGLEFVPSCDIEESDNEYHIAMDVPGLKKEDIQIEVTGNSVRISGERRQEKEEKGQNRYRSERSYGRFMRSFTLPEGIKEDAIEASYEDGVIYLSLPKSEKSKAKKIEIKAGSPGSTKKLSSKEKSTTTNE